MFKNYQSNVLFHLEGTCHIYNPDSVDILTNETSATDNLKDP
jgi:hypothetical protein